MSLGKRIERLLRKIQHSINIRNTQEHQNLARVQQCRWQPDSKQDPICNFRNKRRIPSLFIRVGQSTRVEEITSFVESQTTQRGDLLQAAERIERRREGVPQVVTWWLPQQHITTPTRTR
jgi:hypothetical protein